MVLTTSSLKPNSTNAVRHASIKVAAAMILTSRMSGPAPPRGAVSCSAAPRAAWACRSASARVRGAATARGRMRHSPERAVSITRSTAVKMVRAAMTGASAAISKPPTTAVDPKLPATAPAVAAAPASGMKRRDRRPLTTAVAAFHITMKASAESTLSASDTANTATPPALTAHMPNAALTANAPRIARSMGGADTLRRSQP